MEFFNMRPEQQQSTNTNKLLKEDGVCILRYKKYDFLKIITLESI